MKKILLGVALAVGASSPAAHALPSQTDRFVHEKTGYVVRTRTVGDVMYVNGKHPVTGNTFRVKVSQTGRTTGYFAGQPINLVLRDGRTDFQVATTRDAYLATGAR